MHADLVLVMTHNQRVRLVTEFGVPKERIELLGDFDIEDPPYREILDPYGKSDAVFAEVFSQIDRSIGGLFAAWTPEKEPGATARD
jgi:protein-tyrosine-phosphatase